MRSSVVISLLESDLLEAAVNDPVEWRHSSVADSHPTAEPVEHCKRRTNKHTAIRCTELIHLAIVFCANWPLSSSINHCMQYTLCVNNVHLFIFQITVSKLTDFNDFGVLNPEKI